MVGGREGDGGGAGEGREYHDAVYVTMAGGMRGAFMGREWDGEVMMDLSLGLVAIGGE